MESKLRSLLRKPRFWAKSAISSLYLSCALVNVIRDVWKCIDVVPSWQDHRCNILKNDIQIISFDSSIVGRQTGGQISITDRSLWLMITSATTNRENNAFECLVRGTHMNSTIGHNSLATHHWWWHDGGMARMCRCNITCFRNYRRGMVIVCRWAFRIVNFLEIAKQLREARPNGRTYI